MRPPRDSVPRPVTSPNPRPPTAVYIILYVVLDILIASGAKTDKDGNKSYDYHPGALILLAEGGKLVWTGLFLLVERSRALPNPKKNEYRGVNNPALRSGGPAADSVRLDWSRGIYFLVPAVLYTAWNYLNYQSLLHVPLSVYSIIYQSVLFFSALLWSVVFRKTISGTQWFALFLLAAGVFVIHFKPDGSFELTFDMNVFLVLAQAFCSAVAGVYNEFLYKKPGAGDVSINVQNLYLYTWTTLCTASYLVATEEPSVLRPSNYFAGFDFRVWMIVLVTVFLGISVSLILKHRDIIVKLFAQAVHSPVEVVAAHFVLGTPLNWLIGIATSLIAISTYLFYRPVQKALDDGDEEFAPSRIATAPVPGHGSVHLSLWERSRRNWSGAPRHLDHSDSGLPPYGSTQRYH